MTTSPAGKVTCEDLGRSGFRLLQSADGFRFGEDTVLLAHFAAEEIPRGKKIVRSVELGSNCGALTVLLAARRENVTIDAVEILPDAVCLLRENITLNRLEDRVRAVSGDIRSVDKDPASGVLKSSYAFAFCNPPYYVPGRGPASSEADLQSGRSAARYELNGDIDDFLFAASRLLVPMGKLALVQRSGRLADVLLAMRSHRIEPRKIRFVHPHPGKPATLFLLSGQKNASGGQFTVLPPLILYSKPGEYSDELKRIYYGEDDACSIS